MVLADCGHGERWLSYDNLKSGKSKGCLQCRERDLEREVLYDRWYMMMDRCNNINSSNWNNYGGRGIKVCDKLSDFDTYVTYVKSLPNYNLKLEIDRTDNERGYEIGNLRWATRGQQCRNRRGLNEVTYNNETMCFKDFARRYTFLSTSYARNLYKKGWTLEQLTEHKPSNLGRRAEGLRSGKLRAEESVYGRKFNSP